MPRVLVILALAACSSPAIPASAQTVPIPESIRPSFRKPLQWERRFVYRNQSTNAKTILKVLGLKANQRISKVGVRVQGHWTKASKLLEIRFRLSYLGVIARSMRDWGLGKLRWFTSQKEV